MTPQQHRRAHRFTAALAAGPAAAAMLCGAGASAAGAGQTGVSPMGFLALGFGGETIVRRLVDVRLQNGNGEPLYLGYKLTYHWLGLPFAVSTDGYVLAVRGKDVLYEIDKQRLEEWQQQGHVPAPLPEFELSISDYVLGYLAWLVLAALALVYGARGIVRRRGVASRAPIAPTIAPPVAPPVDGVPPVTSVAPAAGPRSMAGSIAQTDIATAPGACAPHAEPHQPEPHQPGSHLHERRGMPTKPLEERTSTAPPHIAMAAAPANPAPSISPVPSLASVDASPARETTVVRLGPVVRQPRLTVVPPAPPAAASTDVVAGPSQPLDRTVYRPDAAPRSAATLHALKVPMPASEASAPAPVVAIKPVDTPPPPVPKARIRVKAVSCNSRSA